MRTTLRKREILRGYGAFSAVMSRGTSRVVSPLRIFYSVQANETPGLWVGFTTSRQIRDAASRNRLKRLMREAFRFNRGPSGLEEAGKRAAIRLVVLFVGDPARKARQVSLHEVQTALASLMRTISRTAEGREL